MDRPLLDRPPNYDHDYDGRPPVGWHDDDPLLAALMREHPEKTPLGLGGERRKAGERRSDDDKDFCQPGQVKDDRGLGDGLSHVGGNNRMLTT